VTLLLTCACQTSAAGPQHRAPPAQVSHTSRESELPTVQLTAATVSRLGIETATVERASVPQTRLVGGEVIVPPGRTYAVAAPVAGEVHFSAGSPLPGSPVAKGAALVRLTAIVAADRDTHTRGAREVAIAEANLGALEQRVKRNQALVDQRSGSARALEEAIAARDVAQAELASANTRAALIAREPLLSDVSLVVRAPSSGVIRSLSVAEGQVVAGNAPLFEIAAVDALQVRVPVYSGDLGRLDTAAAASVRRGREAEAVAARFVSGPPTAEPDRNSVDRYLQLPADARFVPGERVLVDLPLRAAASELTVPSSAVVLDAWGGAWVYRCDGPRYTRARVDATRRVGDEVVLARGPGAGSCVVSVGAAELFGTEFPPGH
jgi:RND family efflux transporter MFP subunit